MVQDYVMRFKCCEFHVGGISHVLFDISEQYFNDLFCKHFFDNKPFILCYMK